MVVHPSQTPDPCSTCSEPVFSEPENESMQFPETGDGDSFDDPYGLFDAMGDLSVWFGHRLVDGLDWLFNEHSFSNIFPLYLAILVLVYMTKYHNRASELKESRKDQQVLAHIKANDPDLVDEAEIEVAFPHLKGRVSVDDWDEDGNSLHDPERGMRPNYV